ncbi:MAG: hypothetical protein R2879_22400 [Saprospiraceae bacterium]
MRRFHSKSGDQAETMLKVNIPFPMVSKMSEYDYQGWHAYPYIGREFYGIWKFLM